MAVVVAAQLEGEIVNLPQGVPTDVEADSTAATDAPLNVMVLRLAGNGGFVTADPVAASVLATLANGPCTITISQGAGTLDVSVAN